MNVNQYGEFLRLQGYKVVSTKNCRWYNIRPLFYESFPVYAEQCLEKKDVTQLLLHHYCVGIRYVCRSEEQGSKRRSLFVCEDTGYDMSSLHGKARNQTRRGLERCEVKQVPFDLLRYEGFEVKSAAQGHQGAHRMNDLDRKKWERYLDSCSHFGEDVVAFGAFQGGDLYSFVIAVILEDYAMIQTFHNLPDQGTAYSANAVIFTATQALLNTKSVRAVTLGAQTLIPMPELERFKTRMGFKLREQSYKLVFPPFVKALLSISERSSFMKRFLCHAGKHNAYIYKTLQVLRILNTDEA